MNKKKTNQSEVFFKKYEDICAAEIPSRVMARAKQSLLDYIAVTCAGVQFQTEKIEKYCAFIPPEEGRYRTIGLRKDLVIKEAVFLNGLNAHALDYDDGTNSGIIHLGSPVFSLLIPLAQQNNISIEDMLKAAVVGYEVSYTLAVSIQPQHKKRGFHATGTCGTIGAALAAAYMLGFSRKEQFNAFATACVSASGMLKVLDDGSELKPYNVAKAALLALTSIELAKAGFEGHYDPLGGDRGFFAMMTGNKNIVTEPFLLNGTFAIEKSYTKPYASCRYTHPAVEAAIQLKNRHMIHPEDITHIEVRTYSLAVFGHDHTEIPSSYSAKMSIPYSVAAGIIYGKAGLQEFSETCLRNEEMQRLTAKVEVYEDAEMSSVFPRKQIATVEIHTADDTYQAKVDFPKGEPENPMEEEEFHSRFSELMEYAAFEKEAYEHIYRTVNDGTEEVMYLATLL